MIALSATAAATLYLFLTMAALLGVWIYQYYRSRKSKIVLTDRNLLVCEYCLCAYLEDKAKQVTQCPQCSSFNKDNKFQRKRL